VFLFTACGDIIIATHFPACGDLAWQHRQVLSFIWNSEGGTWMDT